jgi:hypothetical protein
MLATLVIVRVVLPVFDEAVTEFPSQGSGVFGLGVPIYVERFDLGPQKMIRTACSEFGQGGASFEFT